jgi:hypothetical protein
MLPDNALSSRPVAGEFLLPDDQVPMPELTDRELGGVALNNASQGLKVKVWTITVSGANVRITPAGGSASTLFVQPGIEEIALAFDQNMHPAVAYTVGGRLYLRWYDATLGTNVTVAFGAARNPKLTLDDKRDSATIAGTSDVILAYLKGGALYYRQQRDRFTVERLLLAGIGLSQKLLGIGMSRRWRLQFEIR